QMRVFLREDQRHRAVRAEFAEQEGGYVFHLAGVAVKLRDLEAWPTVNDVRIEGIGSYIRIFVSTNRMPVMKGNLAVIAPTDQSSRAALLLSTVNPIGMLVVGDDVIQLRGRLVVPGTPRAPTVHSDRRALIDSQKDDVGILGIDPDSVIVVAAGRAFPCNKILTTVGGFVA